MVTVDDTEPQTCTTEDPTFKVAPMAGNHEVSISVQGEGLADSTRAFKVHDLLHDPRITVYPRELHVPLKFFSGEALPDLEVTVDRKTAVVEDSGFTARFDDAAQLTHIEIRGDSIASVARSLSVTALCDLVKAKSSLVLFPKCVDVALKTRGNTSLPKCDVTVGGKSVDLASASFRVEFASDSQAVQIEVTGDKVARWSQPFTVRNSATLLRSF